MTLNTKRTIIGVLGAAFLLSLVFVQMMETVRKRQEAGLERHVSIPSSSEKCVECHRQQNPGIIEHWEGSTHATRGVGCVECHTATEEDADAFSHYGQTVATVVSPMDCGRCHPAVYEEFTRSHHAKGGDILASLDNFLAETVEGSRVPFNPIAPPRAHPSTS